MSRIAQKFTLFALSPQRVDHRFYVRLLDLTDLTSLLAFEEPGRPTQGATLRTMGECFGASFPRIITP